MQRAAASLTASWAEQGHEVYLLTICHSQSPPYPLHPAVKQRSLGLTLQSQHSGRILWRSLRRTWGLRTAIRETQPDVIVSFGTQANIVALLATLGMPAPVIISERTDPSRSKIRLVWQALRPLVYPRANALVCLTSSTLARFRSQMPVRGCVIPNFVTLPSFPTEPAPPQRKRTSRTLIAMGRLVPEKGFDTLLIAFSRIAAWHPNWSLSIVGDGPLRDELEASALTLGIAHRVHFAGKICDPFPLLRQADLFVLSSRLEGFPNALCEAMACGLPVVSFDCPSGPGHIIRHGLDGILVNPETSDALASALNRLMSHDEERAKLAARAPDVLRRFNTERVLSLWEALFAEVLPGAEVRLQTETPATSIPAASEGREIVASPSNSPIFR
ncbi:MAG TPA: glycosyltransferase family 4 protein [Candidatus Angelobacter sp.]|nr:glycosyltransferase family 4 protein [Candidatus Angelobacter sp.]